MQCEIIFRIAVNFLLFVYSLIKILLQLKKKISQVCITYHIPTNRILNFVSFGLFLNKFLLLYVSNKTFIMYLNVKVRLFAY